MITLAHLLTLSAILFSISVAGIFLNRKNVILLLMCVELLLLLSGPARPVSFPDERQHLIVEDCQLAESRAIV